MSAHDYYSGRKVLPDERRRLARKYNDNHDPDDGRFASGDGGSGGGGNDGLSPPRRGIGGALDRVGQAISDTVVGYLDKPRGGSGDGDNDRIMDRLEADVDAAVSSGSERRMRELFRDLTYADDESMTRAQLDRRDRLMDRLSEAVGGPADKAARIRAMYR